MRDAHPLRHRKPQLAVENEQVSTAQREAGDVDGRERVLRVSTHGVRSASVEEQIDDADRCAARVAVHCAVADAAGRRQLAEWLIVRLPEKISNVTQVGTK